MPPETYLVRVNPNEKKIQKTSFKKIKSLSRFTETRDRFEVSAEAAALLGRLYWSVWKS